MLLAHPGTQYSGQVADQLFKNGLLDRFHTGLAVAKGGFGERVLKLMPRQWQRRFANRRLESIPPDHLVVHPWDEVVSLLLHRLGRANQSVLHTRNERFQRRITPRSLKRVDAVIGFDTSGWLLAAQCRNLSIPFVLDQSIGHPDSKSRIFAELRRRYPAWSSDAEVRQAEVRQAEQIEHDLASRIVVASSFTRNTLIENGVSPSKIRLNPYGVDCSKFSPREHNNTRKRRFVFVGSISVRKGVPQLLDVWKQLGAANAELWLIGPASPEATELIKNQSGVVYLGAVPHNEIPALLIQCDAFVLPSFFEGFALVILEAMACGLPVITTTATAGPDIVTPGLDGWIVEPGDDKTLLDALVLCLRDVNVTAQAGRAARRTAEQFTWTRYGKRWAEILAELFENASSTS